MPAPALNVTTNTEADVETRIVIPVVEALGWARDEIHSKVPVRFHRGSKRGRLPEADIVLALRSTTPLLSGLVVIEAKRGELSLDDAAEQAMSYAVPLRSAIFCVCNAVELEVWQCSWGHPSRLAFRSKIDALERNWGELELVLGRAAVLQFYERVDAARLLVGDVDVSSYVRSLQTDVCRRALCGRTLRTTDDETLSIGAEAVGAKIADGICTVLTGSGGRGKSSVLSLLAQFQIRQLSIGASTRIPISIRVSDIRGHSVYEALADELGTNAPELRTSTAVEAWMRRTATLVLIDDWERASDDGRRAVKKFMRDASGLLCSVVVAAREGVSSPHASQELRLSPLSDAEQEDFVKTLVPEVHWDHARLSYLLHDVPFNLQTLLREPVVLAIFLKLTTWNQHGGVTFPRDLPALLDRVVKESVGRNHADERAKTEELIAVCCEIAVAELPITLRQLKSLTTSLASSWEPSALEGELVDLGVLVCNRHSSYEFGHDLWRLHFRTKAAAYKAGTAGTVREQGELSRWLEELERDLELAVPFVAALVESEGLQEELLQLLLKRDVQLYIKALHARATTVDVTRDGWEFRVLASLRSAYASLVETLCPRMRPFIWPWSSEGASNPLVICGAVHRESLTYAFGAPLAERKRPNVVVARSGELMNEVRANEVRGHRTHSMSLVLSGIRVDSTHLVALQDLLKNLQESLLKEPFLEVEWFLREECWYGISGVIGQEKSLKDATVNDFAQWIVANESQLGGTGDWSLRLLRRLASLGHGNTRVVALTLPFPTEWKGGWFRDSYPLELRVQRTEQFFNAVSSTCRQINEVFLPGLRSAMTIGATPLAAHVFVPRYLSEHEWDATWWWQPVGSWDEASAIVTVVDGLHLAPSREHVRAVIAQAKASTERPIAGLGITQGRIGNWGRTSKDVTEKVRSILQHDFRRLESMAARAR